MRSNRQRVSTCDNQHFTDHDLPRQPVCQWVLSVPKRLRYCMQREASFKLDFPEAGPRRSSENNLNSSAALTSAMRCCKPLLSELIGCPISCPFPLVASVLNQGPFPPPALPGFVGTTDLSATPGCPACPSPASGWSSPTTPWGFPCCARFPCVYMLPPLPRRSVCVHICSIPQPYQSSPKGWSGRPAHRHFRGLLGVHSRCGLHTCTVTNS